MGEGNYNNRPAAQRGLRYRSRAYQIIPEMPKPAEVNGRSRGYYTRKKDGKAFPAVGLIASLVERERLLSQLAFVQLMR